VLSVQVNYSPGWHARIAGTPIPIRKDGLGLMAIDSACAGDCVVDLEFGATPAIWVCRILSGLVSIGLIALVILRK
jgi:hypothetical protein